MKAKETISEAPVRSKRRHYDEEFKREAVALIERGRPAAQLARELGISHWNLRDWRRRYGAGGPAESRSGRGPAAPVHGEAAGVVALTATVADLQRELEKTQRQRDILKKALAIVAQENPSASHS